MNIGNYTRKIIGAATIVGASFCPIKTTSFRALPMPPDVFEKVCTTTAISIKDSIAKFVPEVVTNFRGGKTLKYSSEDVDKIRKLVLKPQNEIEYTEPIKNSANVFTCKFGMFGAPRPGGRPHMGLDIFVTPYSRKPKTPVEIVSPLDGVVIGNKHANEKDNIIANTVTILGTDGRKYAFDHMAKASDYPKSKYIEMPKVGTMIKKGDKLGWVGHTGETDLWHLHLCIMTEDGLKAQESSKMWQNLAKKSQYTSLSGQVDPLKEKVAGPIAKLLNKYRKEK